MRSVQTEPVSMTTSTIEVLVRLKVKVHYMYSPKDFFHVPKATFVFLFYETSVVPVKLGCCCVTIQKKTWLQW